ncbi:Putative peptidase M43, pregnancy-associated plasma-A [Colletotrichum destructivum]|uniref:Peptidase M43, pregnancy-associated plasma-A n=1 Tax=Colletotrichum destructivum TaxID=34406 RepID=A0AAX4J3B9_9PEZI|nr:Putative peptidase M43, pregnancy-associated plasma-A [Colletotrichum destructivum]
MRRQHLSHRHRHLRALKQSAHQPTSPANLCASRNRWSLEHRSAFRKTRFPLREQTETGRICIGTDQRQSVADFPAGTAGFYAAELIRRSKDPRRANYARRSASRVIERARRVIERARRVFERARRVFERARCGTRVQSNSPQEPSGSIASGQEQPSIAATTVGPQVSGVRGVNGTIGTASAGSSGAGSPGADGATNTGLSPELATTVAFAAQPSDAFRAVNETAIEATPESTEPTPPDVSSPDQLHAELTVNIPEKAINEKNAKAIAVLETAYFEYFVNKDPAPVDKGKISIPDVISQCQNKYSEKLTRRKGLVDEVLDWVPLLSRDLRGFQNCRAVDSLEVGVYFHYMRASSTAERPNELESRVDTLNEALGAVKINFRFMALNWWEPKANEDWSKVTRHEGKLEEWQRRTRAPGKLVLTVWIVNGLRTSQKDNQELNSYATFPNEKLDEADGIVIEEARVQGGDATTLIHDVGHWLGLGHTFDVANQECVVQDGLTNATQTSGNRDVLYQCSQVTCAGGPAIEINNYMSYSSCRGKTPRDGFTTDQKARMFANALQFRRGYETGECMPDGTAAVKKRSSMQDLLEGKCPDVDKQANILMNTPHSPAATVERSWSKLWAGLAAPWVLMTFF